MSTIYCEAVSRVLSFKMIIYLGRSLPTASSNLPGDETGRLMVSLFGLASDGVYTAASVTGRTVVSYTAFSTLHLRRVQLLFSVALARESPPPDVIRHPALRSPDFPRVHTDPRSSASQYFI